MTLPSRLRSWCALASIAFGLLSTTALASPSSIVPGKQVGSLRIKLYPKGVPGVKPDYEDGAMGQYVGMWVSKERNKAALPVNTLIVKFSSNEFVDNGGPGESLFYIRVTSSEFHDSHGLSTGSTLASIERVYRHLKPVDGKTGVLADDNLGIGFDFGISHPAAASRCIAISVYDKGDTVLFDAGDVHGLVADWKSGDHGSLLPGNSP